MRRRDLIAGLLLATATPSTRAEEPAKHHRMAIVVPADPVAVMSETSSDTLSRRLYQPFFEELRRLDEIEGKNLIVERHSGEGRREGYPDLARDVVNRNPEVIVAASNPLALACRAASGTIPIVWIGVDPIRDGLVTSLARPGGNLTGVSLYDYEIWGKRLQILKKAVPSASKVEFLAMRKAWEGAYGEPFRRAFQEAGQQLDMSVIPVLLQESTPSEYRHAYAEIALRRPEAIMVHDVGDLFPYHS